MGERMTTEEIHARFESEWVLLEDPETDRRHNVLGGKLLIHSKDREAVYREAIRLRPRRSVFLYTGKLPEGTAMALGIRFWRPRFGAHA